MGLTLTIAGRGFLSRWLAYSLVQDGHHVTWLSREPESRSLPSDNQIMVLLKPGLDILFQKTPDLFKQWTQSGARVVRGSDLGLASDDVIALSFPRKILHQTLSPTELQEAGVEICHERSRTENFDHDFMIDARTCTEMSGSHLQLGLNSLEFKFPVTTGVVHQSYVYRGDLQKLPFFDVQPSASSRACYRLAGHNGAYSIFWFLSRDELQLEDDVLKSRFQEQIVQHESWKPLSRPSQSMDAEPQVYRLQHRMLKFYGKMQSPRLGYLPVGERWFKGPPNWGRGLTLALLQGEVVIRALKQNQDHIHLQKKVYDVCSQDFQYIEKKWIENVRSEAAQSRLHSLRGYYHRFLMKDWNRNPYIIRRLVQFSNLEIPLTAFLLDPRIHFFPWTRRFAVSKS